ncbi:hypothetical protein JXL21_12180 [Candidatus Bathyarchaeota archaeon]|nr:hypothetical protein [Candidatus Bathyarchaeota archaeon]
MTASKPLKTIILAVALGSLLTPCLACSGVGFQFGCIIGDLEENEPHCIIAQMFEKDARAELKALGITLNFDVLIDDATGQSAVHLEKVQGLKAMGVVSVVGGDTDSMASSSLGYIDDNNMLMISPTSNGLWIAKPDDNLFRLSPPITAQPKVISEALETFGIRHLVVLRSTEDWTQGVGKDVRSLFTGTTETFTYDEGSYHDALQRAEAEIERRSDEYTAEEVGVLLLGSTMLPEILNHVDEHTYLPRVPWFGTTETVTKRLLRDADGDTLDRVKLFSPTSACAESPFYDTLNQRMIDETGEPLTFSQACVYDSLAIHFLTVLATGAYEYAPMKETLPQVASIYFGASGWCILDENGDRAVADYVIEGYDSSAGGFTEYARYDGVEEEATWGDKLNLLSFLFPTKTSLTCTVDKEKPSPRDNVAVTGRLSPAAPGGRVHLRITDWENQVEEHELTLDSSGRYTHLMGIDGVGRYHLEASYPGDDQRLGSEADTWFNVLQGSHLTCTLSDGEIAVGETVDVTGSLDPSFPGAYVDVQVKGPDDYEYIKRTKLGEDGRYSTPFTPRKTGSYTVKASWLGNNETWSDETKTTTLEVKKITTTLRLDVEETGLHLDQSATITTSIQPKPRRPTITLTTVKPDGSTQSSEYTPDASGGHTQTVELDAVGDWTLQATWGGDQNHTSATSEAMHLRVDKKPSSIEITSLNQTLLINDTLVITGRLQPACITGVHLTITCNDTETSVYAVTDPSGEYRATLRPEKKGTYHARAAWRGDDTHSEAESDAQSFEVKPPQIGFIKVHVVDRDGAPIPDANVTCTLHGDEETIIHLLTNAEGIAELGDAPVGQYEVSSQKEEYRPGHASTDVPFHGEASVTVQMEREGVMQVIYRNSLLVTGVAASAAAVVLLRRFVFRH